MDTLRMVAGSLPPIRVLAHYETIAGERNLVWSLGPPQVDAVSPLNLRRHPAPLTAAELEALVGAMTLTPPPTITFPLAIYPIRLRRRPAPLSAAEMAVFESPSPADLTQPRSTGWQSTGARRGPDPAFALGAASAR